MYFFLHIDFRSDPWKKMSDPHPWFTPLCYFNSLCAQPYADNQNNTMPKIFKLFITNMGGTGLFFLIFFVR